MKKNNRNYLSKMEINKMPDISGVYFLYQKNDILVYIGKAKSIKTRIIDHDQNKEFDRIGYEETIYMRTRALEKELLTLYVKEHGSLPYYNKQK